ncbi:MAG: hypothetical protein JRH04_04760 [Deltaproteobacteria bacterium]|nr:hypothetical protein [Deltaproteobacteria bacterium]
MSWVVRTPYLSSYHAGFGLWRFAGDSIGYHEEAIKILNLLKQGDYVGWWSVSQWWHVKLIAMSYWVFTPHPLSFAPVNAAVWAISIMLVHRIIKQLFPNRQKLAVVSGLTFGLCPSYLLNTTQLLKEPLYVVGVVIFVFGWVALLLGRRSVRLPLIVGLGVLLACINRLYICGPLVLLSLLAMIPVIWRARQASVYALLAFVLVVGIYVLSSEMRDKAGYRKVVNAARNAELETKKESIYKLNSSNPAQAPLPHWLEDRLLTVLWARNAFARSFPDAGSNIDTEVHLRTPIDLVRYIPRAFQIGFLAPFPDQWFKEGKSAGRISRLIAGLEMAGWYFLLPGFVYFLCTGAPALRIRFWLVVFSVSVVVLTAVLVTNIGALMRMRFVYFLPIIIGGLEGWSRLIWRKKMGVSTNGV